MEQRYKWRWAGLLTCHSEPGQKENGSWPIESADVSSMANQRQQWAVYWSLTTARILLVRRDVLRDGFVYSADANACNVARVSCNVGRVSCNVTKNTCNITRNTCNITCVRVRVRRIHKAYETASRLSVLRDKHRTTLWNTALSVKDINLTN